MILKERPLPIEIKKEEALLRRIEKNDPRRPKIEENLAKRWAGYRGEKMLDYHLGFLPHDKYFILNDLRLPFGQTFFQIDSLIFSTNFGVNTEVKNIIGTLFFENQFQQLIRILDGNETGFQDPIAQVKRQKLQLSKLFEKWHPSQIPLEYLVAISHPTTIIKSEKENPRVYQKVFFAHQIPDKIETLWQTHNKQFLTLKDIKKLSRFLIKHHTPKNFDVLKYYGISPEELKTGIQCPKCLTYLMIRHKGSWLCQNCGVYTKNAYVQAVHDYFLLVDSKMTNSQCCSFLQFSSPTLSRYLLSAMNLPYSGANKGRVYFPPDSLFNS
ncbi:nuclease-related domain-containing protein [Bacillus sp. 1NLA3E]|uniref:nuclease-related domain-containing protein n=1 Tax=Bacillus sp. 1NLA3E TaxID=666686 RepID=UPI000247E991|nr:nuclease-related domain-containing protein [Bacillus sp. 1NLA3E]